MTYKTAVLLLVLALASCAPGKDFVASIESLSMEVDHQEVINVGSTFTYTIYAHSQSGRKEKIRQDDWISFDSTVLEDMGKHKAKIVQPLRHSMQESVPVPIRLTHDTRSVISTDTLHFNFKGPIIADWRPTDGEKGSERRASAATLFGRDGLKGKPGGDGEDGSDGPNFTGYLWMADASLRMVLINDTSELDYFYRSNIADSVVVFLSGGNGGNGGNGSNGGDGKDAKGSKPAGNGGDGGNGGNGGDGGNGGSLLLFVHPNAAHLSKSIHLVNPGGFPGVGGITGAPGAGGKDENGRIAGAPGNLGTNGAPGQRGTPGPPVTVSVVAFDYTQFHQE